MSEATERLTDPVLPYPRRCRHRLADRADAGTRPNPYRTHCFLCGGQRCVACERFEQRLVTARPHQVAALRSGQANHWAKYHTQHPPLDTTAAWVAETLAVQADHHRHGLLARLAWCWSPLARAERTFHAGRLGDALALATRAGREDRILAYLQVRLPVWAAKAELLAAARELLVLRQSVTLAQRGGVSATLTAGIAQDTATALDQLWQRADRLALVAAQQPTPDTIAPLLAEEASLLRGLAEAAVRARDGLALATLRGGAATLEPIRLGLDLRGTDARSYARH